MRERQAISPTPEGSEAEGFGCIGSPVAAGSGTLPGKCQSAIIAALTKLALASFEILWRILLWQDLRCRSLLNREAKAFSRKAVVALETLAEHMAGIGFEIVIPTRLRHVWQPEIIWLLEERMVDHPKGK